MQFDQNSDTVQSTLSKLAQSLHTQFDKGRNLLSFDEYLLLLAEKPEVQTRGSAKYLQDMLDFFGTKDRPTQKGEQLKRFLLFDQPSQTRNNSVIAQEEVQNALYQSLRSFAQQGFNNRLLLLHGPNGSAKTSILQALMQGLEQYSLHEAGAAYHLQWVFPSESITKSSMGIRSSAGSTSGASSSGFGSPLSAGGQLSSYAHLPEDEIAARIGCDLRDHPFLLIPKKERLTFLTSVLGENKGKQVFDQMPHYLRHGDLCHRCKLIFDALANSHHGDVRKVYRHIQVERLIYSKRYRRGLASVEPQMHVDAHYQQLTMTKSLSQLPIALQSLNLFSVSGDLIDGNRGLIEFSDLLKRPVDAFKYLLIACETGAVNIGATTAYLDTVMLGSTNEVQLDAFKEFPDFNSFKARIELIRVPYLLRVSDETRIYEEQIQKIAGLKHVAPHSAWTVAQWAILTRLKKPNSIHFSPQVSPLISHLSPIEKSRLYDTGEVPSSLSPEEKKLLRSNLKRLLQEYQSVPYYEGRVGASAREMINTLFEAAQNNEFTCLTPLPIFKALEELIKRVTEYEFLKQDVKDGYHDATEFIHAVRVEYLNRLDREVKDSIGLYETKQWEDFLKRYIQHAALILKKEKIKNPITGKMEDPDLSLIEEFEKIVGAPTEMDEVAKFRQNNISQVGAWSLDHPNQEVSYSKVFPEYWRKLEKHYFETQKHLLTQMNNALTAYNDDERAVAKGESSESAKLALKTLNQMKQKYGYCDHCAKEVITFLMRNRY